MRIDAAAFSPGHTLSHALMLAALALVSVYSSQAALVTVHADSDGASAVLDGVISPNEYGPGNSYAYTGGGTPGFGGQLGNATLYMNSDFTRLYVGFSGLGVPGDANQYIIYFHARPGGFQPNGLEMNDGISPFDGGRRNTSILSSGGVERVTFNNGTEQSPDFALFFNNRSVNNTGFQAFVELAGFGNSHIIRPRLTAGLGTANFEFSVALSTLGMTNGGAVDFEMFDISGGPAQSAGYMANEGIPDPNVPANIGFGFAAVTNTFTNFHRFVTAIFGPQTALTQRVANQTLQMPQEPTVFGYFTSNAFPTLSFSFPLAVLAPPDETNRLFVVEQGGRILVITNLASPDLTTFMNLSGKVTSGYEEGLLAMAFHPDFKTNRYFYLYYTANTNSPAGSGRHDVLARYEVAPDNANTGLLSTELILLKQRDEAVNHNGGELQFGPEDGYLYLSLGDEGGGDDEYDNSQLIDKDFFSGMIRIDVDMKPGSLAPHPHAANDGPTTNYAIPPDNPFIGFTQFIGIAVNSNNVRTEYWAVGLRNPYRMAFDEFTDELYCGDVGQDDREEVDVIVKGGNYGWKWREGQIANPGEGAPPAGFTNAIDPVLDYPRGEGNIVTGGRVYRGSRFPDLHGKYIFSDYGAGTIWYLTHDGTNATSWVQIADETGIAYFGRDPRDGDLLLADHDSGQIKRLERSTAVTNNLPGSLADCGVFQNLPNLVTYEGIVPYDLNVPFWSDNARKTRWFCVPSANLFMGFDPQSSWQFPTSMVWVKHFDIETNTVPSHRRRLETRLLVRNQVSGGGYGVTYRWGDSTTNAYLVPEGGTNEVIVINESGNIRTQVWHYPSRAECLQCHQVGAGFALGFNTPQINRDFNYGNKLTNQLAALEQAGYFSASLPSLNQLRKLAHPTNTDYSIEYRARSYLQANCAQCHFPGGIGQGSWIARLFTPLSSAGIVNGAVVNNLGDPLNRVIKPATPANSVMLTRISTNSGVRMPPLASNLLDTQAIALVTAWIGALTGYQSFADWQLAYFGSTVSPDSDPHADPDEDGGDNYLEWLTGTNPTNAIPDSEGLGISLVGDQSHPIFNRVANRGFEVQYSTNLVSPVWQFLDVPDNQPFFSATDMMDEVADPATNASQRFYRLNVYEP